MEVAIPTNEPAIHRLVDDILENIFLLNATPPPFWYPPDNELTGKDQPTVEHATTLASSQVCTRWRSIAFNCHMIWGLIIDYRRHSLRWIERLLDRSNPSSLDFGGRLNYMFLADGEQDVLELVFNHIDRLRIFNAHLPASSWELVCSRFLHLPAPNLEFMFVHFYDFAGRLTHPLFNNHAPNLRNFGLSMWAVDFTSPVFLHLTELLLNMSQENGLFTILDWLNILGGMPSLRSVQLDGLGQATSRGSPIDILPFIHLDALDILMVQGPFHECVALVKHLILPPRCGLRLRCGDAHLGSDQRELWAIIKKRIGSWAKNVPYRRLNAETGGGSVKIGNIPREDDGQELDPIMSISLYSLIFEESIPLFHSLFTLFEQTFFGTTILRLLITHDAFTGSSLFDHFRGFANLEKLVVGNDCLPRLLFPFLQSTNPVLFPTLKSLYFFKVVFHDRSDSTLQLADFLQWRRECGFPVQMINIGRNPHWFNREYVLSHIQDTVVENRACAEIVPA